MWRGGSLFFSPPLELPLRVVLLEGDVEGLRKNLGHMFLSILDANDFRESLELVLEIPIC